MVDIDSTLDAIVCFAAALDATTLPADVLHDARRRLLDTLGCGIAAVNEPTVRVARDLALRSAVPDGATVLGTCHRTLPELAAFANSTMSRVLEGNDTFPGGGGHPSDMILPLMAVAEASGRDGRSLIGAIVVAYEIYGNLFRTLQLRDKGLDHPFYTCVGTAAGSARLLGLDAARLADAIALAVTANLPLQVTRRGEISMWKGAAAANAARNGVFAALLAARGMTGPARPFEGTHGLAALAGAFSLAAFPGSSGPFRISEACLKYFTSEYHSIGPITLLLRMRDDRAARKKGEPGASREVASMPSPEWGPDDIERIVIHTYRFAFTELAGDSEKWRPRTRETADHSLPYIAAAVLVDGAFDPGIFAEARLDDHRILALADRIEVREDPDIARRFPAEMPCRIEIALRDGRVLVDALDFPRGHFRNPMTDAEVADKFRSLASSTLAPEQVEDAIRLVGKLESQPVLTPLIHVFARR